MEESKREGGGGGSKTAALSAYGLVFTGLALIFLSVLGKEVWHWPDWIVHFVRDLGLLLSAVMAGTILHEKLLRDEMELSFARELNRKLDELRVSTAAEVHRLFTAWVSGWLHRPQHVGAVLHVASATVRPLCRYRAG